MVTPVCPKCGRAIPVEEVNVAKDIAYCRNCNLVSSLSELTRGKELEAGLNLCDPPVGTWYREEAGQIIAGASHRSVGGALGMLFFGLFWNGIVSVFVLIAIAGTLSNMGMKVPHWFRGPKMNGGSMGLGMTIFLWIFLIPFIAIGMAMIGGFLTCVAGRTEVRILNREGVIFTGIGSLGWRRRFNALGVKHVSLEEQQWRDSDGDRRRRAYIFLTDGDGKELKLGAMLPDKKRRFLAAALRKTLVK